MVHLSLDRHRERLAADVDEEEPLLVLCLLPEVHRYLGCRDLLVCTLEASLEFRGPVICSLQLSVELVQAPSSPL